MFFVNESMKVLATHFESFCFFRPSVIRFFCCFFSHNMSTSVEIRYTCPFSANFMRFQPFFLLPNQLFPNQKYEPIVKRVRGCFALVISIREVCFASSSFSTAFFGHRTNELGFRITDASVVHVM